MQYAALHFLLSPCARIPALSVRQDPYLMFFYSVALSLGTTTATESRQATVFGMLRLHRLTKGPCIMVVLNHALIEFLPSL